VAPGPLTSEVIDAPVAATDARGVLITSLPKEPDMSTTRSIPTSSSSSSSADPVAPAESRVLDRLIRPVLRIDAVGSGLIGAALVVAPGWPASGLGTTSTSIRLLGALLVVNAWIVARPLVRPTRARFAVTGTVDVVFAAAVAGAIGFLSPTAAGWAPWALAGIALLSLDLGALKLLAGQRRR
jgi:hypothetical protein